MRAMSEYMTESEAWVVDVYRATRMHSADNAVVSCLSVRLSVPPSVTRRYSD